MTCSKCNTQNLPQAKFCASCGASLIAPLSQAEIDNQSIKSLLIIIGIDYLASTVGFVLHKVVIPSLMKRDDMSSVDLIYKCYGWTSDIVAIGALLFFLVTIKNRTVKTALGVFILLRFIFLIGYRLLTFPI